MSLVSPDAVWKASAVPRDPAASERAEDQTSRAYRSIRRMIVDGGLPPGSSTSHRSLADKLGIGRSPVRDAILQLEAEGPTRLGHLPAGDLAAGAGVPL